MTTQTPLYPDVSNVTNKITVEASACPCTEAIETRMRHSYDNLYHVILIVRRTATF